MLPEQTILYTGNFSIENMNAAGKRVFANALILKRLGYHVVLVGTDEADHSADILCTGSERDGIEIYHYTGELFQKHRFDHAAFFQQLSALLKAKQWQIGAIIGYNSPSTAFFIGRVQRYCRKQDIRYITDVADWLIVDAGNPVFRMLRQLDITLKNACYSNRSDGVIAVSTWLESYYKRKVANTLIVPPIAFERRTDSGERSAMPLVVYAGIPFRKGAVMKDASAMKDRFDIACDYLSYVKQQGIPFEFHIYGFTKDELIFSIPGLSDVIDDLGDSIIFHGPLPMQTVQDAVCEADYTLLIREDNRMTRAGFPTKVSESITCGTPVITTKTSDIALYLSEDRGAYFLDLCQREMNCQKVAELMMRTAEERRMQKDRCREIDAFDMETYCGRMREFLEEVLHS